jgi:hypothetical protein
LDQYKMPRVKRAGYDYEDDLQVEVAAYLDRVLPDDAFWWHTPNQGRGDGLTRKTAFGAMVMGQKLKSMGMRAGIPDILLLYRGILHCTDAKARYGGLTDSQKEVQPRLLTAGARVGPPIRTIEELEALLIAWDVPLKFLYTELKTKTVMKPSEAQAMTAIALSSQTVKKRRATRARRKIYAKSATTPA